MPILHLCLRGAGCDMLKQTPNLGSAVNDLQQQMTESDAVCIAGQNSSGVADACADENVLQAPAGIISYEPDELMISLYAGSTIAETARLPIKAVYNGNKPREWGFRAVKK